MSVISRGSFAKEIYPGVHHWAQLAYKEYEPEYTQIFQLLPSTRAYEEIVGFQGMGNAFNKPEGQPIQYRDMEQGYLKRITPITYGLGFIITRETYDDGLYPSVSKRRAAQLARSFNHTKEEVHADVLNNGFDANFIGWDGQPLFSTAHPSKGGFTYSNRLTVDADLSETSLEQACIDIEGYEDPAGLKIKAQPRKLIIPRQSRFIASRILQSELQNDSANNAINALKTNNSLPEGFMVNHWLTDANAFFIKTDCEDGLICVDRKPFEMVIDNDTDTQNAKYGATMRFEASWADPRGIYGSPGV